MPLFLTNQFTLNVKNPPEDVCVENTVAMVTITKSTLYRSTSLTDLSENVIYMMVNCVIMQIPWDDIVLKLLIISR